MNNYFVYRDPTGEWWVSEMTHRGWWEPVGGFATWREAFDHAYGRAGADRDRYRSAILSRLARLA